MRVRRGQVDHPGEVSGGHWKLPDCLGERTEQAVWAGELQSSATGVSLQDVFLTIFLL